MIEVKNIETHGWQAAIRGMRNPYSIPGGENNSWAKSDSHWTLKDGIVSPASPNDFIYTLGPNDLDLACRLVKAGPEHRKFVRMIHVQMDITAPMYWVAEHDTYKVGTTRNSCSFMHKGVSKPFELKDFTYAENDKTELQNTIDYLNTLREEYLATKDDTIFFRIRQLLPQGYNITYTWDGSMETILSILKQRKGHRLPEWETFRQVCFDNIPYCKEFYNAMTGDEN